MRGPRICLRKRAATGLPTALAQAAAQLVPEAARSRNRRVGTWLGQRSAFGKAAFEWKLLFRDNAASTAWGQMRANEGNAHAHAPPLKFCGTLAGMAELVDALDSKSSSGNRVGVRFPLPVPAVHCNV